MYSLNYWKYYEMLFLDKNKNEAKIDAAIVCGDGYEILLQNSCIYGDTQQ